ncbi:cyclic lactone autoinducer peptide [Clostridium estertheticum]|nr:cyclic lactone autoinducer peptide [Clostridium estertheticum]
MKKLIHKTMKMIGCVALFVGSLAIVPTSLINSHQPNCPDEFLL